MNQAINRMFIVLLVLGVVSNCFGSVLHVPSQFSSISDALNNVSLGDTISLKSGDTFIECIKIDSKRICFVSDNSSSCNPILTPLLNDSTQNIYANVVIVDSYVSFIDVDFESKRKFRCKGIDATNSKVELSSCTISGFTSDGGSGITAKGGSTFINRVVIKDCIGDNKGMRGGGVYLMCDSIVIKNTIFENNEHLLGYDGGVLAMSEKYGELASSIIRFNKSKVAHGGGTIVGFHIVRNCLIDNNTSSIIGGIAIARKAGNPNHFEFTNNVVINNSAKYDERKLTECGGIAFLNNKLDSIVVFNCCFFNNKSDANGGGAVIQGGTCILHNNMLYQNVAKKGSTLLSRNNANIYFSRNCSDIDSTIKELYLYTGSKFKVFEDNSVNQK